MSKSNAKSKLVALTLAVACGFGAWKLAGALLGDDEAQGTDHLVNQVWLERMPENDRDMIGHLLVMKHPQGRFGAAGKSSSWRHFVEVFRWNLRGDQLEVYFPQEQVKGRVTVRTWECEGQAPEPFELCLEISNQGRSAMFYSREDWKVRPHELDDSMADIAEDYPELGGLVHELGEGEADALEAIDLDVAEQWPAGRLPF
ncbi:MAG: hypothetical protein HC927_10630 [Deltaproteobacteria bacterium]|nr:hypothetical protein [Deltaproteobacteria bacterium]